MSTFYRLLRRALTLFLGLSLLGALGYYILFTVSGIVAEVDLQSELNARREHMVETATFIAPTLEAESLALAALVMPTEEPTTPQPLLRPPPNRHLHLQIDHRPRHCPAILQRLPLPQRARPAAHHHQHGPRPPPHLHRIQRPTPHNPAPPTQKLRR
ncbi:MAG: hypothetical protein HC915_01805 [Anaerolineae bacterium]|nr:hypothetical protein [Anaerolineae bacterium]